MLAIFAFQLTAARRRLPLLGSLLSNLVRFQLTAARRRLPKYVWQHAVNDPFQLTAARRRLPPALRVSMPSLAFQLTAARRRLRRRHRYPGGTRCFNSQPPEGGCPTHRHNYHGNSVSTHSRPKAAASRPVCPPLGSSRFNSQPPEGGCILYAWGSPATAKFQLTAARRRLRFWGRKKRLV